MSCDVDEATQGWENEAVASPMLQLILQPFPRFTFITGTSLTSPDEPPMVFAHFLMTAIGQNLARGT